MWKSSRLAAVMEINKYKSRKETLTTNGHASHEENHNGGHSLDVDKQSDVIDGKLLLGVPVHNRSKASLTSLHHMPMPVLKE